MTNPTFTLTTPIWVWTSDKGPASWHFLSIEGEVAEEIKAHATMARLELGLPRKRGWNAVKISARVGETEWETSIFPDKDTGGYLLPVKKAVRKAEGIVVGDEVAVIIELI